MAKRGRPPGRKRKSQTVETGPNAEKVKDYRHEEKRPNNPPAGLATYDKTLPSRKVYDYDPHLDPQLVWAGKKERTSFEVENVALHIHERISTAAIIKAVQREEPQRELFADPQLPLTQQIEFYQHEMNWANRLILGDSLLVMNSLLERELMAGKVLMIYMDPPYGVRFRSNFQPTVRKPDPSVQDKDENLTREPEQIKAYRDTWTLGVHSYLTYLRDRLLLSRELLADSGSIFVQIGDENVHYVRQLLDEVFAAQNFVSVINYRTMTPLGSEGISKVYDYLLWYAKNTDGYKFHFFFEWKPPDAGSEAVYVDDDKGKPRSLTSEELGLLAEGQFKGETYKRNELSSSGLTPSCLMCLSVRTRNR
jgi:adenine-specific DNA-methyltransferase